MIKEVSLRAMPKDAASTDSLLKILSKTLAVDVARINDIKIVKRSVDARRKPVVMNLTIRVAFDSDKSVMPLSKPIEFRPLPESAPQVVIVGAGPAGLFAALRALELGIKPVVLERGKDVDSRRKDIVNINRNSIVDEDSNYCFGEGGAGTFSDGKLFTRSKKRGNVADILQLLHQHGASEEILIDSHPHIGSDRLPHIVKSMRETIIEYGGEVRFNTRVVKILTDGDKCVGVEDKNGEVYHGPVVLATGHSARDVYYMLQQSNIELQAKGFAVGVRLEHPQRLIDCIQYHSKNGRGEYLPAAEYSFVAQVANRGVYSFCMCPGGVVVPAESGSNQLVVNGMSASARAGKWANSGMVVEIRPGDFPEYEKYGCLQLLKFQEDLEKKFFDASNHTLQAPAQRMKDFTDGKLSTSLPSSSYVPGLQSHRIDKLLPPHIAERLQKGFVDFGRRSKGFLTNEAVLIGLESRTSSPVRIPRDKTTYEHSSIKCLYPCGEGAGFAGGIVSAAIDGRCCIDAFHDNYIK